MPEVLNRFKLRVFVNLNNKSYYTQPYASNIAILIMRKNASIISELMQKALKITEGWSIKKNLKVNPAKVTLIPLTKRRKPDGL